MAIKIDNHPNARPQSGLLDSDLVIEEEAEGGSPVSSPSSSNPTRRTWARCAPCGPPTSASSARSAPPSATRAASRGSKRRSAPQDPGDRRDEGERGDLADKQPIRAPQPPRQHRQDARAGRSARIPRRPPRPVCSPSKAATRVGEPASAVHLDWAFGNNVDWEWDEDEGLWMRSQQGSEHTWIDAEEGGEPDRGGDTGHPRGARLHLVPPPAAAHRCRPPRPQALEGLVFHDGKVIEGTWERETVEDGIQARGRWPSAARPAPRGLADDAPRRHAGGVDRSRRAVSCPKCCRRSR